MEKQRPTYSQVIQCNNNNDKSNSKVEMINYPKSSILIKPIDNQNHEVSKKMLGKEIDPVKLKIKINQMNNLPGGAIKIQCDSRSDSNKLKEQISNKLKNQFIIQENILKQPKIKITGIKLEKQLSNNELQQCFTEQNDIINDGDHFEIEHIKYIAFKNTYTIFARVNGNLYKKIMNSGNKLFFGWQSCIVYDSNILTRCFKCNGFNHTAKNCRNKLMCSFCAGEHTLEQCKKEENNRKCGNCLLANRKFHKKCPIDHSADEISKCESFKHFDKLNKSKIAFHE